MATVAQSLVIGFDHHVLAAQPHIHHQLASLYCRVFEGEPFNEYRQCSACNRYFSRDEVEKQGIRSCSNGHRETPLVVAWELNSVKRDILAQASEAGFYGVNAFLGHDLVGFAWARLITWEEVRAHWSSEVVDMVQYRTSLNELVYFDELGVDPFARRQGIGRTMVNSICSWAKQNHPHTLSLLRTHMQSPARRIFERAGYTKFADDSEFGAGRIMMFKDVCGNFVTD